MDCDEDSVGPWHVVPVADSRPHVVSATDPCWCDPYYDKDADIYVHNSADGREEYEEGRRKPH